MRRLPVVLLTLSAAGCTLDYDQEKVTPPDQVPQMVFTDLKQSTVKDGRTLYTIQSSRSEVFPSKNTMRLTGFVFEEYDQSGKAVSTGRAETGVIDTSSNDATVTGRLEARSDEQGVDLEIDGGQEGTLTWVNESRQLRTGSQAKVLLKKADGSRITADGLTLDLSANRLELESAVQGTWTQAEKP